jgi:spermidine/putrescine transport system permease protein
VIAKVRFVTLQVYLGVVLAFIFAPVASLVLMSFHAGKIPSFPIEQFSAKWYNEAWSNPDIREGAWTSLSIASLVAPSSTLLGFVSAHLLSRRRPRWEIVYIALISLPCIVPLLLSGVALLMYDQRIHLAGTKWSIIVAHICYCSPFAAAIIRMSYQSLNIELEQAAYNLGASPARVILEIVIPQLWPSLLSAAIISFLISWDEFVLAWFVGGFTKTLPTVVYGILGTSYSPLLNAVGTMAMLCSVCLLITSSLLQRAIMRRSKYP